jgi:hypothetical protein
LSRLRTLALLATGAIAAFPGAAGAACQDFPTSQPFAQWGDDAQYSLMSGGSFEGSLSWTGTGSPSLAQENDPFNLSGTGTTSARLRGRQAITSPPVCITAAQPYMRFVARALDKKSRLVLEVLWNDKSVYKEKVLEEHPADLWGSWGPSKIVQLGKALPTGSGEIHEVRLRFSLKDRLGEWLVDDVFIDPYKRG